MSASSSLRNWLGVSLAKKLERFLFWIWSIVSWESVEHFGSCMGGVRRFCVSCPCLPSTGWVSWKEPVCVVVILRIPFLVLFLLFPFCNQTAVKLLPKSNRNGGVSTIFLFVLVLGSWEGCTLRSRVSDLLRFFRLRLESTQASWGRNSEA